VGSVCTVPNCRAPLPTDLANCLRNILSSNFYFSVLSCSSVKDSLFAICSSLTMISFAELKKLDTSLYLVSWEKRFLRKSMILLLPPLPFFSYEGSVWALMKSDAVFIILDSIYLLCSSYCISSIVGALKTFVICLVNANFLLWSLVRSKGVYDWEGWEG
jgi:hypothetical protein